MGTGNELHQKEIIVIIFMNCKAKIREKKKYKDSFSLENKMQENGK